MKINAIAQVYVLMIRYIYTPCKYYPICTCLKLSAPDVAGTGPTDSTNLLLPSLRGLVIYYMDFKMEPNTTTIRWLYSPGSSPCVASSFQVGIYTQSEINSTFSMDLVPIDTFETTEQNITFTYSISGYIGISAIQTDNSYCATSTYLHRLPSDFNG